MLQRGKEATRRRRWRWSFVGGDRVIGARTESPIGKRRCSSKEQVPPSIAFLPRRRRRKLRRRAKCACVRDDRTRRAAPDEMDDEQAGHGRPATLGSPSGDHRLVVMAAPHLTELSPRRMVMRMSAATQAQDAAGSSAARGRRRAMRCRPKSASYPFD